MAISFLSPWLKGRKQQRRRQIFDGVTKSLFESDESGNYILHFKDQIESKDFEIHSFPGKGSIANRFSELMMQRLEEAQVATHFIRRLNMSEQLVKPVETFPFTVSTHNVATGTFASRLGLTDLSILSRPVVEFNVKLRHNESKTIAGIHIDALNWTRQHEVDYIYFVIGRINDLLIGQLQALGLRLLNFTVEFGRHYNSSSQEDNLIILSDELSPECFTVQDIITNKIIHLFTKKDQGYILDIPNYLAITQRFGLIPEISKDFSSFETISFPTKN